MLRLCTFACECRTGTISRSALGKKIFNAALAGRLRVGLRMCGGRTEAEQKESGERKGAQHAEPVKRPARALPITCNATICDTTQQQTRAPKPPLFCAKKIHIKSQSKWRRTPRAKRKELSNLSGRSD